MNEHEHIQRLRDLWSRSIMGWLNAMVPLGGGLFGLFSYLGQGTSVSRSYSWLLPILGWLIFATVMITWRIAVRSIDQQIVAVYPRILELEQQLGWGTHAIYFYNNLSTRGRAELQRIVRQCGTDLNILRINLNVQGHRQRADYRQFAQAVTGWHRPHDLLLEVWDRLGTRSVGDRGHGVQNIAVAIVYVVTGCLAFLLSWSLISSWCANQLVFFGLLALPAAGFCYYVVWLLRN